MPVGAPPQTTRRLRRKDVDGGSAPSPLLGLRPRPRWKPPPPGPQLNGVWGGAPTWSGARPQRGSGSGAPSYILAAKPPRGLGGAPNDSIKPTNLVSPRGGLAAGWAPGLGFATLTFGPFGLAHPPNWIQTNMATQRRDQTGGLIVMTSSKFTPPWLRHCQAMQELVYFPTSYFY